MRLRSNEIVIATRNAGKVKEFAALFGEKGFTVRSLKDYPEIPDIVEDGQTFAENALIKARTLALALKIPVVADDSGLAVERLGGAPGVYSARYAGEPSDDAANNRKLLDELNRLEQTGDGSDQHQSGDSETLETLSPAKFICAMALVDEEGCAVAEVQGECPGEILRAPRGQNGFGYDPLFYMPELKRTMAELSMEEKNALSHRGQAMRKLWEAVAK